MVLGEGHFLLEMSQENLQASLAEITFIAGSGSFKICGSSTTTFEISGNGSVLTDSVFVKTISRILYHGEDIEGIRDVEIPDGKFYVRFRDADRCGIRIEESILGDMIGGTGKVSFRNPDFVVRVIHDGKWYAGIVEYENSRKALDQRRAPMKPFFSPVSMHPMYARFMVNLSGTKRGDTILDPFCGTGGILVEAGLMGRTVIGSDSEYAMVRGARLNLKYYGVSNATVTRSDINDLQLENRTDAILTDLPYGRNSRVSGHDIHTLYEIAFRRFNDLLREGGRTVVVLSDPEHLKDSSGYFKVVSITPVRQHKSLTRYFAVLERP